MAKHRIEWVPCVECVDRRDFQYLRDADVVCLICGRPICAGHIEEHLGMEHMCDLGKHRRVVKEKKGTTGTTGTKGGEKGATGSGQFDSGSGA